MSTVLYRKYRPQTFREITNQNHVKITLEQEVAQEKFGHAYIFSGPRGVGKTSIARILAKALNCTEKKKGTGEPCNKCAACGEITIGKSLDVMEIDAASHTGVDTVREVIIDTARFAPSRLRFKIFIIDEMHMLSTSAWNALLKILEEPPAHVIFIFATTEIHKVPATILSRCQRFEFKRISAIDLIERLKLIAGQEKRVVAPAVFQNIARLAEGSARDAESLLEQVFALGEKEITEDHASIVLPRSSVPAVLDFLKLIFLNDARGGVDLINHYLFDGFDLSQFTSDIIEVLRKMLLVKIKSASQSAIFLDVDEGLEKGLKELVAQITLQRLLFLIELFMGKQHDLKYSPIPQLPLEMAVVEACGDMMGQRSINESPVRPATIGKIEVKKAEQASVVNHQPLVKKDEDDERAVQKPVMENTEDVEQAQIDISEIKAKWPEVLRDIQKENNSLPLVMNLSEPLGFEKGILKIGVGYDFYRDKLNTEKSRVILAGVLKKCFNCVIKTEAVLVERKKDDDSLVQNVLDAFGGKVVE